MALGRALTGAEPGAQCPQLIAVEGVLPAQPALLARDPQMYCVPIELIQAHLDEFGDAQAMVIGEQHHGVIAGAMAALLRRFTEQFHLAFGEIVAGGCINGVSTLNSTVSGHGGRLRNHDGSSSSRGGELMTKQP
jgi:hypothetical protein